jgi:hypothetical protein
VGGEVSEAPRKLAALALLLGALALLAVAVGIDAVRQVGSRGAGREQGGCDGT